MFEQNVHRTAKNHPPLIRQGSTSITWEQQPPHYHILTINKIMKTRYTTLISLEDIVSELSLTSIYVKHKAYSYKGNLKRETNSIWLLITKGTIEDNGIQNKGIIKITDESFYIILKDVRYPPTKLSLNSLLSSNVVTGDIFYDIRDRHKHYINIKYNNSINIRYATGDPVNPRGINILLNNSENMTSFRGEGFPLDPIEIHKQLNNMEIFKGD